MPPVRILLADSHAAFLKSAADWLDLVPSLEVVGRTRAGAATLILARQLNPDLVLVAWSLLDMRGFEVTRRLKTLRSTLWVVLMALDDLPQYRAAAEISGADGFIAKADLATQLLPLIHSLCDRLGARAADAEAGR